MNLFASMHASARSKHSRRGPLLLLLAATVNVMWWQPVLAQDAKGAASPILTKAQRVQLQAVMRSADAKVEAGFKGQEKLKEEMLGQLKVISAMKGKPERTTAIATFHARYKKPYTDVLAKGGLKLDELAGQLRPMFPNLVLSVTSDLTIVGRSRNASSSRQQVTPVPTATTRDIPGSDFEVESQKSCSLAAGGDVTSTNSSLTVTALAVVAGGCSNSGTMRATVPLPAARKAAGIHAKGDLSAEALAVAIAGAAVSQSTGNFYSTCGDAFAGEFVSVIAVAPFLWVGSAEEKQDGATLQLNAPAEARECFVTVSGDAAALAGAGDGAATGAVKRFSASVTIEP